MPKSHTRNATNFYGKPKGWTFDGGFNLGFEGSWVSGSKSSKSSMSSYFKTPKPLGKKGKKI